MRGRDGSGAVVPADPASEEASGRRRRLVIILVAAAVLVGGLGAWGVVAERQLDSRVGRARQEIRDAYVGIDVDRLQMASAVAGVEDWDAPADGATSDGGATSDELVPGLPSVASADPWRVSFEGGAMRAAYRVDGWAGSRCVEVVVAAPDRITSLEDRPCR